MIIILAGTEVLYEHFHAVQKVAPSGATGVLLTSGAGAWNLGAFSADIIAAGAEILPYDVHWLEVSDPNTNAEYEIVLYYGATDIEAARIMFTRANAIAVSLEHAVMTPIIPAGSRLRAKMMDSVGASTCRVKVNYHNY